MSTTSIQIESELAGFVSAAAEQSSVRLCERLQELHYDQISDEYDAHYNDCYSVEYRRKFIYGPMFEGLDVSGKDILDAMCGSGQTTEYLLSKGARITGLDISNEVMDAFSSRWSGCKAIRRSLFASGLPADSFDSVVIVGGLHHIQPNVSRALHEIHRVLKPGGYFCFMEPYTGSLPDSVRRLWYKHDHFFSENEASVDIQEMEAEFADRFVFKKTKYLGNLAFLLVFNSLIFRIPLRTKFIYSPLLLRLEPLINKLQGKLTSCFVVGQWQKK